MENFVILVVILVLVLSLVDDNDEKKEATKADSFKQVNEIVAEAKTSPNGKPLLDYIISLQKDGLTEAEAKDIAVKYEDWKLFYSLKDAEANPASTPQQDKGKSDE